MLQVHFNSLQLGCVSWKQNALLHCTTVPLITFTRSRHKPHWFIHIDYRWSRTGVPQLASDDTEQMEDISKEILRKILHNLERILLWKKIFWCSFYLLKTWYLYRKFLERLCFDSVDIIYFLKQTKTGPRHDGPPVRLIIRRLFSKRWYLKFFGSAKLEKIFDGAYPNCR